MKNNKLLAMILCWPVAMFFNAIASCGFGLHHGLGTGLCVFGVAGVIITGVVAANVVDQL